MLHNKRGDTINIIAKNDSGIWLGAANGKIGHFKFVNVEEIKNSGRRKLNPFVPTTFQAEVDIEPNSNSEDEQRHETSIYDDLKARLNESNGSMNLADVLQVIGLSNKGYLDILALNGFEDLQSFADINMGHSLSLMGINESTHQRVLLNASRIIREHLIKTNRESLHLKTHRESSPHLRTHRESSPHLKTHRESPSILNSSQLLFWDKNQVTTQSAPATPAVELATDFSQLISKLETLSTSSLEGYDEIQHYGHITNNLRRRKSHSSVNEFCEEDKCVQETKDESIYENFDKIINSNKSLCSSGNTFY